MSAQRGDAAAAAARTPIAVRASDVPIRQRPSVYPEPFASLMAGRSKRALGDPFELRSFGVNLTTLAPGAISSLRHAHAVQDEFVYVLAGELVLVTERGRTMLRPGDCAGFCAGTGDAHHLRNESNGEASYLEIGDRSAGDSATYPDDDLEAVAVRGGWAFRHKSGAPYS